MKIEKLLIVILIILFFACNNSKSNVNKNLQPEIEFDFSDKPENTALKDETFVNDLEKILSEEQNKELENYLLELKKKTGKKVLILTVPSSEKVTTDWNIQNGFTNSGIIITVSESLKEVGIGIAKDTETILSEKDREKIIEKTIIPEFEKGNYYNGIKNGIEEILKKWD